jgi:hypothetical protein
MDRTDENPTSGAAPGGGKNDTMLFAQLIEILTQNAVMMLGAVPDRSGRQRPPDLNAAEMMIDMLAVLQKRTKGNLNKDEERMISGTLYQLQSAFAEVASRSGEFEKARKATEAAEAGSTEEISAEEEFDEAVASQPQRTAAAPSRGPAQPAPSATPASRPASSQVHVEDRENKVKFTKKYG